MNMCLEIDTIASTETGHVMEFRPYSRPERSKLHFYIMYFVCMCDSGGRDLNTLQL